MRAQMAAPGIGNPHLAVLAAPHRQILAEVAQRPDLPHLHEAGKFERVPAKREADIELALCRRWPPVERSDPPVNQILPLELFEYLPHGHRRGPGICFCAVILCRHCQPPPMKT